MALQLSLRHRLKISALWTGLQAIQLSPCTTYTDIQVLESFILRCLPPCMLHSPSSFEVSKPSLAGISKACTGEFQHSWQTGSALSLLTSCCLSQRTQILDVDLQRCTPVRGWKWDLLSRRHPQIPRPWNPIRAKRTTQRAGLGGDCVPCRRFPDCC